MVFKCLENDIKQVWDDYVILSYLASKCIFACACCWQFALCGCETMSNDLSWNRYWKIAIIIIVIFKKQF